MMVDRSEPFLNHNVQDTGPISRERILKAVEEAEEAFWATISEALPEISGEAGPEWYAQREHDNNRAVVSWIDSTRSFRDFEGTEEDLHEYIYTALGETQVREILPAVAGGTVVVRVELTDGRVLGIGDLHSPFMPNGTQQLIKPDGWSVTLHANLYGWDRGEGQLAFLFTESRRPLDLIKLMRLVTSDN